MRVYAPEQLERATPLLPPPPAELPKEVQALAPLLPVRPPGFCTGCPERPIFTAMKLLQRELGQVHISCDIGCHLFSILPPFNLGNTTMGYGLGAAGASAFNAPRNKRAIAVMGDGGFWHNGLTSGVGNAVFNQSDNVLVVVDNGYSAATGGQDILSSRADNRSKSTKHPIARGRQRRRREMAAGHRPDLRHRPHARRAARGDDDAGEGAEGRAGRVRVHAQSAASRETCVQQGGRRRSAHGARALRRRSRYVHRRSFVHPPVGLSLADHQAQSRSAAPGSDRARRQLAASAAECAAKWRMRRCCARRSIARNWCSIRRAGIACCRACARASSASSNGAWSDADFAMPSDAAAVVDRDRRARRPGRRRAGRLAGRSGGAAWLDRAGDLGCRRGAANRNHRLLPGDECAAAHAGASRPCSR